jgi:hypothetical protein
MAKWDRQIEVAARIKTLRDELRRWEAEFERLMSGTSNMPTDSGNGTSAPGSLPAKVLVYLESHPDVIATTEDVTRALGTDNAHAVGSALARLLKAHRIQRLARGKYAALTGVVSDSSLIGKSEGGK